MEAQALSDADTLYKAIPVTPVLLSPKYMEENGMTVGELARKIITEQGRIEEAGYYFYDAEASQRYTRWAEANLELWRCIDESLSDPDVSALVEEISRASEFTHWDPSRGA